MWVGAAPQLTPNLPTSAVARGLRGFCQALTLAGQIRKALEAAICGSVFLRPGREAGEEGKPTLGVSPRQAVLKWKAVFLRSQPVGRDVGLQDPRASD